MFGELVARTGSAPLHVQSFQGKRLDVRTESEWNGGHIHDALHIHGGVLKDRFQEVPNDRPVAVVCGTGYRGSIAASFLKSNGYGDVSNVLGGMTAWKAAGLPTAQ